MKSLRFWVKPHPTMSANRIKNEFSSKWPKFFEFINFDTQSALRKADILISGMSSICLEAMALGIPVLVVEQAQGLQFNPIPNELNQDLSKNCKTSQDILDGIELYKNRDNAELVRHKDLGLQIRETYFEPVTRLGVLKFLGIEGDPIFEES
jgi:CDP-glycerol glycerophosphotransferase (TagB/SpsB family)